ncbi:MAG: ABC transporter permease [Hyphomicrobiales bacterium]
MTDTVGVSSALSHGFARLRGSSSLGWSAAAVLISLAVALPLAAIALFALRSSGDTWTHLVNTVLPSSALTTVLLMTGVGVLTLVIGTSTAWLVTMYRFPGRQVMEWLLLLPLAMPTYIIAFCYMELFDYSGLAQTALRAAFGWSSAAEYWFPDIRTLAGAIVLLSFVLYPYVYLTARASFLQQSVCVLEVSRTLGCNRWGCFRQVALPLARPALVAGVTLALMECLNDIGAVEFLGVKTLTVSVYDTWLNRGSLSGAAQIACVMLVFVFALLFAERAARGRRHFHHTTGKYRHLPEEDLGRTGGVLALLACLVPVIVGFVMPAGVLASASVRYFDAALAEGFWRNAANSLTLSAAAAFIAVVLGVVLAYACRITRSKLVHGMAGIAATGYAVPGTVLAVGILVPLAGFDNAVDAFMRERFGISTGLLLSGTAAAIVMAYTVRFLAVSLGAFDSGLMMVSRCLDAASRALGVGVSQSLLRVHLPILRPALGAAALLVFVDSMKELPATLLLRPFDFNTLATHIYELASLDRFEESALSALTIVAIGLAPVILIHKTIVSGRPGTASIRKEPLPELSYSRSGHTRP